VLLGCFSFKTLDNQIQNKELLDIVIASKPQLNFSAKEIPKNAKKAYKQKYHSDLSLANPGSPYNKTDVVYKNEPYGMLLFSGIEKENVGFVLFESKGISTQSFFIYYKLKNKSVIQMEKLILKGQPKSFDELRQILVDKQYL
jgi:hypothetical protein